MHIWWSYAVFNLFTHKQSSCANPGNREVCSNDWSLPIFLSETHRSVKYHCTKHREDRRRYGYENDALLFRQPWRTPYRWQAWASEYPWGPTLRHSEISIPGVHIIFRTRSASDTSSQVRTPGPTFSWGLEECYSLAAQSGLHESDLYKQMVKARGREPDVWEHNLVPVKCQLNTPRSVFCAFNLGQDSLCLHRRLVT